MTETLSKPANNQNDHIMAALAHATALIPMMGVVAPIVIWVTQKDKSEYVAFQALQAIVYQFTMIIAHFIGMACYILTIPLMILFMVLGGNKFAEIGMVFPLGVMFIIFIVGGLFILYGLFAAIMNALGKDFRYILIGNWVKKYLEKQK